MIFIFLGVVVAGLSCFGASGKAVNISSTWFLPQEGFPVFYRYFNDKMTWNEAEAVCGFHHADLLSVQRSSQMDAARAYLKEIDVTDNIWIGLQKESPEKPFSWTNGEKLLGDGYWLEPIPKSNEKLCAAIDPVSDFRWNSFYCRGPQVASFICELPVPEWAKKEDGCMITSIPSLVVTLIPEMGVIQLFSDCGLDGSRRIACKGGVNREEIIKRLSCDEDAFSSTIFSKSTTDTTKELNTQQSTWLGVSDEINRDETTQTLKVWETYVPQTRHRRDSGLSSLGAAFVSVQEATSPPSEPVKIDAKTSTQVTITQSKKHGEIETGHVPSHVFPHSPYLASERNSPSTKTPAVTHETTPKLKTVTSIAQNVNITSSTILEKSPTPQTELASKVAITTKAASQDITTPKPTDGLSSTPLTLKTDTPGGNNKSQNSGASKGLPVLIITGESFNDSAATKSDTPTSENPQIVFLIDEKEGFAEPYLVPIVDDVNINNPSTSPLEIIDVDLVDVGNMSAKSSTVTQSNVKAQSEGPSTVSTKLFESVFPLRIKEKKNEIKVNQSTAASSPIVSISSTSPKSSLKSMTIEKSTAVTLTPLHNVEQQPQNVVVREDKGDTVEIPQRPNRGRFLTHSNHPSFYPYFLNRVLG